MLDNRRSTVSLIEASCPRARRFGASGGEHVATGSKVYDHRWRRIRLAVLERDGYRCRINGPRCTGLATQVDHIVEVTRGGAMYDPTNLRAACRECNTRRSAINTNRKRHAPPPPAPSRPDW